INIRILPSEIYEYKVSVMALCAGRLPFPKLTIRSSMFNSATLDEITSVSIPNAIFILLSINVRKERSLCSSCEGDEFRFILTCIGWFWFGLMLALLLRLVMSYDDDGIIIISLDFLVVFPDLAIISAGAHLIEGEGNRQLAKIKVVDL
ncbi:unnamed protein product, partial [Cercopithifilaria johnstoni]